MKDHRGRGIFTALLTRVLERMVPITATISPANQSGAAGLLEKIGFHNVSSPGGEQRFRWNPGVEPSRRD